MNFDDLEVDENAIYNTKINALQKQLQGITARLSFPAFVQVGMAGYKIAEHYVGKGMPAILGGIAGAYMMRNKKLSEIDRQILVNKVNAIRGQISGLERQRDAGLSAQSGIMSASDLEQFEYPKYDFKDRWNLFFGDPSVNCHYMVFGLPKSGKSTFCMHFAKYLADNFGSVLYVASEEGFSQTLKNKLTNFGLTSSNMHFSNYREAEPIMDVASSYDFIFIDSVNFINISPEQVREMKSKNPSLSLITIQQSTKDGDFRGSQEYAHDCDSIVRIADGIANQQGRFQEASQMMVFPKRDKKEVIAYEDNISLSNSEETESEIFTESEDY
jgi:predicted ATP-dependent serine protease